MVTEVVGLQREAGHSRFAGTDQELTRVEVSRDGKVGSQVVFHVGQLRSRIEDKDIVGVTDVKIVAILQPPERRPGPLIWLSFQEARERLLHITVSSSTLTISRGEGASSKHWEKRKKRQLEEICDAMHFTTRP